MEQRNEGKTGYKLVICRSIKRNGKIIYPTKAKFFRFWVKVK